MLDFDAKSARPHPEHRYYVFHFRTSSEHDVVISGEFEEGAQKMWTLCLYDMYGIPLAHTYSDDTIRPLTQRRAGGGVRTRQRASIDESRSSKVVKYSVLLTTEPRLYEEEEEDSRREYRNVMDVSSLSGSTGTGLIRIIYPRDNQVVQAAKPRIELVPRPASASGSSSSRNKKDR